jgi:hypothetical protein
MTTPVHLGVNQAMYIAFEAGRREDGVPVPCSLVPGQTGADRRMSLALHISTCEALRYTLRGSRYPPMRC